MSVQVGADFVAIVEIQRPPSNFFDVELIRSISDAYEMLDADTTCRAIVLCSQGKHFCAGANLTPSAPPPSLSASGPSSDLYAEAARMVKARTPVVAAIQGAAVGGGLGLACSADFRVGCPEVRMTSNFSLLEFHHGFGLTVTLPPIVGQQAALELLLTGKRLTGEEARRVGLLDRLVQAEQVRVEAHRFATEIAQAAPLAVLSIRATMRAGLTDRFRAATTHESIEQARLRATEDYREGVQASAQRRTPNFAGR